MTIGDYQHAAARTMNPSLSRADTIFHAVFGMQSEVGEISGILQKIYQGHDMDEDHLQSELGDLLWFVAECATAFRWNLHDIMERNIEKLRARYPDGFDPEKSLHRRPGDI